MNPQQKRLNALPIAAVGAIAAIAIFAAVALDIINLSSPESATAQTPDIHTHGEETHVHSESGPNDEPHFHGEQPIGMESGMMPGPSLPIPIDNDCLVWASSQKLSDYAIALIELNPTDAIATDEERRTIMRLLRLGDYVGKPDFAAPGWELRESRYHAAPAHPCIDYISIPLTDAPADYRDPFAYAECALPLARKALSRENNPQAITDMPAAQAIEREGVNPELYALSLIAKDAPPATSSDKAAITALIQEGSVHPSCAVYNPRLKAREAWEAPARAYPILQDAIHRAYNAPNLPVNREDIHRHGWTPALGAAPISATMNIQKMTPTLKGWTLRLIACADDGVNCPAPNRDK